MNGVARLYYRLAVYGALLGFFGVSLLFNACCGIVIILGLGKALERQCRGSLHTLFRLWIWVNRVLGLIRFQFPDQEKLSALHGRICIANHPTILDAPLLASIIPNGICVYKKSLASSPFYGAIVKASGFLPNIGGPDMVRVASSKLAEGSNLIIFPDGTRTHKVRTKEWKGGFALIAKRAKTPIALLDIGSPEGFLDRDTPLFQTHRVVPATMRVEIIDEIEIGGKESIDSAMARIASAFENREESNASA